MANGEGRISFPKWALAFVVPAVVVIVMFGVNNYRQGQVEKNLVDLRIDNASQHKEMQSSTNNAIEKFSATQDKVNVNLAELKTEIKYIKRRVAE
jgi:hypothetical protein